MSTEGKKPVLNIIALKDSGDCNFTNILSNYKTKIYTMSNIYKNYPGEGYQYIPGYTPSNGSMAAAEKKRLDEAEWRKNQDQLDKLRRQQGSGFLKAIKDQIKYTTILHLKRLISLQAIHSVSGQVVSLSSLPRPICISKCNPVWYSL